MSLILRAVSCAAEGTSPPLDDVDVTFRDGLVTCVLGPGGAGKTRLLDVLAGVAPIDRGEVACEGPLDPRVAYQSEGPLLPPEWTVGEYLEALGVASASPADPGRALGLGPCRGRLISALAPRERRALWVMAALGRPADVYLLDEPALGMDRDLRAALAGLLRAAAGRGATVVAASVDLDFVCAVASRLVLLRGGRVLAEGPAAELAPDRARLDALWLDRVGGPS